MTKDEKTLLKLVKAYRALAAKVYSGKPNWSLIEQAWSDLRNFYLDCGPGIKKSWASFDDFLACQNCVSYRELRAER